MAAQIRFFAGEGFAINNLSGSGLHFYGAAGGGASVQVGSYNERTFIGNAAGTSYITEVDNIKYLNTASGIYGQTGSGISLTSFANYQATLNIRLSLDSAGKSQNAEVRIYDRSNINNDPSGVTCKLFELIHPANNNVNNGSGDSAWESVHGSSVVLSLIASPGVSGERPAGINTSAVDHDWYIGISVSPDSVSSKLFGLYMSAEYL